MKYGLIGTSLGESLSPFIHGYYGNSEYETLQVPEEEFEDFMVRRDFLGINVTMPYKKKVIEYLDRISPEAERMGSVNTVLNEGGALIGFNTDYFGLKELLDGKDIDLDGRRVMILGTGGAAEMARALAMDEEAISIHMLRRDGSGFDENAEIVINATPVGMHPNIFEHIDLTACRRLEAVVDMVYSPVRSELCIWAMSRGIKYAGGLYMLCCQASYSHELFFDEKVPREKVADCFGRCLEMRENIVLTGMPSCGKTKYGKMLSEALERPFFDTDGAVEEMCGKSIREIIETEGEEAFRAYESEAVRNVSLEKGAVISTGGGAVLSKENIYNLRKNGRIYFIDRPLCELEPSESRPLSDDLLKLEILYNERYGLYLDSCDVQIATGGTDEETVFSIGEEWKEHILFEESDYI